MGFVFTVTGVDPRHGKGRNETFNTLDSLTKDGATW
ncbi:MAG: hypothetical protein RLZZ597_2971 [Cyanobacteriota bacterium]|jgi:hypothetical protein